MEQRLLTAESVSEGHPDKIADQLSDAVLDAILAEDPHARVACEAYVKSGMVLLGGEISTQAWIDIEAVTRSTLRDIGYVHHALGFDAESCAVLTNIGQQSHDIQCGVDREDPAHQGAGDQGVMFGYATRETDMLMPAPIFYAHQLMMRQAALRKQGALPWLRPDAKVQLTLNYVEGKVHHVESCVLSTQHDEHVSQAQLQEAVMELIIKPTLPLPWQTAQTRYFINPTGRFVIGGPKGDCGLTGRKLMVDTYGPAAHHGGGAFSGKDPSKVDRSAAYMARYIAKNIVAAGLAVRCEVSIAYAIGVADPVAFTIETFGTGLLCDAELTARLHAELTLTPYAIIQQLDLLQPRYRSTAAYGHFGRPEFPWEATDRAQAWSALAPTQGLR